MKEICKILVTCVRVSGTRYVISACHPHLPWVKGYRCSYPITSLDFLHIFWSSYSSWLCWSTSFLLILIFFFVFFFLLILWLLPCSFWYLLLQLLQVPWVGTLRLSVRQFNQPLICLRLAETYNLNSPINFIFFYEIHGQFFISNMGRWKPSFLSNNKLPSDRRHVNLYIVVIKVVGTKQQQNLTKT